ncbi:hypothetical protein SPRG_08228 [Saprolegnia parasitica CBS 223.65]|uniref:Uncharacterized protein n=1 Tax=Saprolegnia parasitica (strain CBS 223.65) TaxID=695850 RepID=A0A067CB57_SAPPC|nr:hypothetical protein SPRG_08228 [Saprolegnia parasitica CBS 223.65]KDO26425.1 hypothetical protein SPRG_08228 [Saprolegnia parasitica CBS 223.65]|eukprot:XP_012202862.1 hypothetical protein SPRG_08228 [Saprolegnia parasitica CBS 223.65]
MLGYGILSIVLAIVACLLASFALVVPAWSALDNLSFTGSSFTLHTRFAAGVWGYCTDVRMDTSAGSYLGHCVLYQPHASTTTTNSVTIDGTGLCTLDTASSAYAALRSASHLDASMFDAFAADACGVSAWLTLACVQVVIALAVIGIVSECVALVAGCCGGKRFLQAHATLVHLTAMMLALFMATATMIAWAVQAPAQLSYGASFHWLIAAFVLCMASLSCGFKYRIEALRVASFSPVPLPTRPSVTKDDDLFGTSQTPYQEEDQEPAIV